MSGKADEIVCCQYLAKKAVAFNMKIKYFNRRQLAPEVEDKYNASYCSSLHELLACSDVVSLNCPLNAETTGLIGRAEFAAMKQGTFLVNTARGAVMDEKVRFFTNDLALVSCSSC